MPYSRCMSAAFSLLAVIHAVLAVVAVATDQEKFVFVGLLGCACLCVAWSAYLLGKDLRS